MLTIDRLREVLHYDPQSGVFTWRETPRNPAADFHSRRPKAGKEAGTAKKEEGRRLVIGIDGKRYQANRLAWLYMTGEWPTKEVDHINVIPSDNRWANLRLASRAENLRNTRLHKNNQCGLKGVDWDSSRQKWRAQICCDYKRTQLGRFDTKEEAKAAYDRAAAILHGEFARV